MALVHDTRTLGETEEEALGMAEDWEDGRKRCTKQQNHEEFVEITGGEEFEGLTELLNSLDKQSAEATLSKKLNSTDLSSLIRHMARLTGRIKVGTVYCTGFVQAVRQGIFPKCPCRMCQVKHQNGGRGYILTVTTALYVVEKATAQCPAEMELSWNQDGCPNQLTVHMRRIVDTDKDCNEKDWCAVEFITHETEIAAKLKLKENLEEFQKFQGKLYRDYKTEKRDQLVIIVSHPPWGPKQLSYCRKFEERKKLKYVREDQEVCRYSYDAPTCVGSSGAPVFILGQPLCGYGYWLGHPPIHSRGKASKAIGYSSVGYEHVDSE